MGNYTATASFDGNKYFRNDESSADFKVKANADPCLSIKVDDIYVGQQAVAVVDANESFNGDVNVQFNTLGSSYTVNLVNGHGSVAIDDLAAGNYTATVSFEGDDTYMADEASTDFAVKEKLNPNLKVSASNIVYGGKATVTVSADAKFSGTVAVSAGTKNFNVKVTNGKGTATVSGLAVGTYTIKASSAASETYNASTASSTFKVNKANAKIIAKAKTFNYGVKTKIYSVSLKSSQGAALKNQKITMKLNGKTYSAKTNAKGVASFIITNLNKVGTKTAVISYAGDKNYNKVSAKAKITVKFVTMKLGCKDKTLVKKLQRALKKNHFYIKYNRRNLIVDGIYRFFTKWAVKKYQLAKGLRATGNVDLKTALRLKII